jgi:uncharacterized protein (TIGR02453 family)
MKQLDTFKGFSKEALLFLDALEINNNKEWFTAHKEEYNRFLLEPFKRLVNDLGESMFIIDSGFEIRPAINKTISRIQRDVRFSKDKSPYKTAVWITFKQRNKDWKDAPAYFFELSANSYRFGMGLYSATPTTMKLFRNAIDEKPKEFEEIMAYYKKQNTFHIEGAKYVRIFDKNKSEELLDWYQRKNIYFVCNREADKVLFSTKLVDELTSSFFALEPIYRYLLKIRLIEE